MTNQTHPEARAPVLSTAVMYHTMSGFVQIVNNIVGTRMMYIVDPTRLRITMWNSKTGNRVVVHPRHTLHMLPSHWRFVPLRVV